jgi:S1-C subfamily serine protease
VLVARVRADSPAASAGIKAGDVITTVNGSNVSEVADVTRAVRRGAGELALTVVRDRKELTLKATLPDAQAPTPLARAQPDEPAFERAAPYDPSASK